ncbi:MAG: FAD-dependent oxidoreductase, partial [Verrucomicrobiia bacterium]
DRSRLGGNSSSEVKMHVVGADCSGGRPGWREGGLIEELRLDDAVHNPHRVFELWDLFLYDKVVREANITLLLDSHICGAVTEDGRIRLARARSDRREQVYTIEAMIFIDCTGDSRLALECGAEMRRGREAKSEFNESLGLEMADEQTLGSSILFTARDCGKPVRFVPPAWARRVTRAQLKFRPVGSWEYGYWWIEWGGQLDTVRDDERIRFELLSIALGVWDYIKNSGDCPASANWGLTWLGMLPGKRESRRIIGDHILTEHDLTGPATFEDAVAVGGWPLDDHPPSGFDRPDERPAQQVRPRNVYQIPLRSLYSRNVQNLMMAGRNISATHVALTSTRVMATCAAMGQAAGTAAAQCALGGLLPRSLVQDKGRLSSLQQTLLRDDQTIPGIVNEDHNDLARGARATASGTVPGSNPANVTNGAVRDLPGETRNIWAGPMTNGEAWIELAWPEPVRISRVQMTFDTGFQRPLTLTAQDSFNARMIRGPQPETVRDYELSCVDSNGSIHELARVTGNYQRLVRHDFPARNVKSVRLHVTRTNGADTARVYEIRAYG